MDRNRVPYYVNFFIVEGLVCRIADNKTQDSIDVDKITENLLKKYRLRSISKKENWISNISPLTRAISPLSLNYAALGNQIAQYYDKQGKNDKAIHYYKWVYKIIKSIDRKDLLEPIADKLKELKK